MASDPPPDLHTIDKLSRKWNALGRAHCRLIAQQIAAMTEDPNENGDRFTWPNDKRDPAMAAAVIAEVQRLNAVGRWHEAKALFDPAHEPFISVLDQNAQSLPCVTILGIDNYLVRTGEAYKDDTITLHINGNVITPRPDILASAASPNHNHFLIVKADGFWISDSLDGHPTGHIAWMEQHTPQAIDNVQIADDGQTIACVAGDESGVWLAQVSETSAAWHRVYPTDAFLATETDDDQWFDSMMHCALSPDGRFIAYGSQCYGHFIDAVLPDATTRRWAEIGYHSEYPHHACFSEDGTFVAMNSCHFYNGATVCASVVPNEGAHTDCYEESEHVKAIDTSLRVYASAWLPAGIAGHDTGIFALGGVGYLNSPDPFGKVIFRQEFGSSASSMDFCPKTRRLVLASYSGFIHVYDVDSEESPDRVCGYKARKELYRWILWKGHEPFRW
jgi:hypothetical protein